MSDIDKSRLHLAYAEQHSTLINMGFESSAISEALEACKGNLEAATATLLGDTPNNISSNTATTATKSGAKSQSSVASSEVAKISKVTGTSYAALASSSSSSSITKKSSLSTTVSTVASRQQQQLTKAEAKEAQHNHIMATYKVQKCKEKGNHDKRFCPGWHTRADRRRNPFENAYTCAECPISTEDTPCKEGDACTKAHNMIERMFHPEVFKISMCQRGPGGNSCERGTFCAFAHNDEDHRIPLSQTIKNKSAALTDPDSNNAENGINYSYTLKSNNSNENTILIQERLIKLIKTQGPDGIISSELPKRYFDTYSERLDIIDNDGEKIKIKELLTHPHINVVMHKGVQPKYVYEEPVVVTTTAATTTTSTTVSKTIANAVNTAPIASGTSSSWSAIISGAANVSSSVTSKASAAAGTSTHSINTNTSTDSINDTLNDNPIPSGVSDNSSVISSVSNNIASIKGDNSKQSTRTRTRGPSSASILTEGNNIHNDDNNNLTPISYTNLLSNINTTGNSTSNMTNVTNSIYFGIGSDDGFRNNISQQQTSNNVTNITGGQISNRNNNEYDFSNNMPISSFQNIANTQSTNNDYGIFDMRGLLGGVGSSSLLSNSHTAGVNNGQIGSASAALSLPGLTGLSVSHGDVVLPGSVSTSVTGLGRGTNSALLDLNNSIMNSQNNNMSTSYNQTTGSFGASNNNGSVGGPVGGNRRRGPTVASAGSGDSNMSTDPSPSSLSVTSAATTSGISNASTTPVSAISTISVSAPLASAAGTSTMNVMSSPVSRSRIPSGVIGFSNGGSSSSIMNGTNYNHNNNGSLFGSLSIDPISLNNNNSNNTNNMKNQNQYLTLQNDLMNKSHEYELQNQRLNESIRLLQQKDEKILILTSEKENTMNLWRLKCNEYNDLETKFHLKNEEINNLKDMIKDRDASLARSELTKNSLIPELKQLRSRITQLEDENNENKKKVCEYDKLKQSSINEIESLKNIIKSLKSGGNGMDSIGNTNISINSSNFNNNSNGNSNPPTPSAYNNINTNANNNNHNASNNSILNGYRYDSVSPNTIGGVSLINNRAITPTYPQPFSSPSAMNNNNHVFGFKPIGHNGSTAPPTPTPMSTGLTGWENQNDNDRARIALQAEVDSLRTQLNDLRRSMGSFQEYFPAAAERNSRSNSVDKNNFGQSSFSNTNIATTLQKSDTMSRSLLSSPVTASGTAVSNTTITGTVKSSLAGYMSAVGLTDSNAIVNSTITQLLEDDLSESINYKQQIKCSLPGCDKSENNPCPYTCNHCSTQTYCSLEHQMEHWKIHGNFCSGKK